MTVLRNGRARQKTGSLNTNQTAFNLGGLGGGVGKRHSKYKKRAGSNVKVCGPVHYQGQIWSVNTKQNSICIPPSKTCSRAGGVGRINAPRFSCSKSDNSQSININIRPPVFTSPATFSAAENQTSIGTVTATDANGDSVTFTLVNGNGLQITSVGVLSFVSAPDYETQSQYTATVSATDGENTSTQNITVTVMRKNIPSAAADILTDIGDSLIGLNLLASSPRPVIDLWMEIPSFPPRSIFPDQNKKCFTNFNTNIINFCNYYKSENIVIRISAPADNWRKTAYRNNTQILDYISSKFSFYEDGNENYTLNCLISQLKTVKNLYFLPYVEGKISKPPNLPTDYEDNRTAFWTAVEFTNWYIENKISSIKNSDGTPKFKIQLVIEPENMGLPGTKYRDDDAPTPSDVTKTNPYAFTGNQISTSANSVAHQINYLFQNKKIDSLKTNYNWILNHMPLKADGQPIPASFAATTGTTGGKGINTVFDSSGKKVKAVTTIFGQWYNFGNVEGSVYWPPFKDKKPNNLIKIFNDNIKLADTNKDYYTPLLSIEDGTKRNLDDNAYYGVPSQAYYNPDGKLVHNDNPGYTKAAPPQLASWEKPNDFTWSNLEDVVEQMKNNTFSTDLTTGTIQNVMIFGAHYLERNLGEAAVTSTIGTEANPAIEGLGPSADDYSSKPPYKYNNYGQYSVNLSFS